MQLRQDLDDLLCRRYPALYAGRHGDPRPTGMYRGFEIGDGWFGIVDALSEVLSNRAAAGGRPCPEAKQVKQKLGSLRFYADVPGSDRGAIDLAEEMSRRVCEVSGRPGRLCQDARRWLATLAPGVPLPGQGSEQPVTPVALGPDPMTGRMDVPPLGFPWRIWPSGEPTCWSARSTCPPAGAISPTLCFA